MIELLDGPAKGTYTVERAPMYLRAVIDPTGRMDLLDQLEDEAKPDEQIYVYQIEPGTWGWSIVHYQRPKRVAHVASGRYHWMGLIDGEQLRDNADWRAWALAQSRFAAEPVPAGGFGAEE